MNKIKGKAATSRVTAGAPTRKGGSWKTTSATVTSPTKSQLDADRDVCKKLHPKTLDIPDTQVDPSTKSASYVTMDAKKKTNTASIKMKDAPVSGTTKTQPFKSPNDRLWSGNGRDNYSKSYYPLQKQSEMDSPLSTSSSSSTLSSSVSGIPPSQFTAICKEVAHVREEHVSIMKCLGEREGELMKARMALRNIAVERDALKNKMTEFERMLKHSPERYAQITTMLSTSSLSMSESCDSYPDGNQRLAMEPSERQCVRAVNTAISTGKDTGMKYPVANSKPGSSPQAEYEKQECLRLLPSSESSCHGDITAIGMTPSRNINGNEANLKRKDQTSGDGKMRMASNGKSSEGTLRNGNSSPHITRVDNINQEPRQPSHNNKNFPYSQTQHFMKIHQTNINVSTTDAKMASIVSLPDSNPARAWNDRHEYCRDWKDRSGSNSNANNMPVAMNNNNNSSKRITIVGGSKQEEHHHSLDCCSGQHQPLQSGITGLDLMLLGGDCSTRVVEHLVHPIAIESNIREIQHKLVLKGVPANGDILREVEVEIDRLNSRIDHLRSQNDVLSLNLEDAKSHANRLTTRLGQYESNNVALHLALRYSDQMSDAYEVLAALLESELGQVVTNIRGQINLGSPSQRPQAPPILSSGALILSQPVTSSGNNNNSNDNSPTEHTQSPSQNYGGETMWKRQCQKTSEDCKGHEKGCGDNNSHHQESLDGSKSIVATANPGSTESKGGATEQARLNRLSAEQAARCLLQRHFSENSISPTEFSNDKLHDSWSFMVCLTQHSSNESINSNLSNMGCGESDCEDKDNLDLHQSLAMPGGDINAENEQRDMECNKNEAKLSNTGNNRTINEEKTRKQGGTENTGNSLAAYTSGGNEYGSTGSSKFIPACTPGPLYWRGGAGETLSAPIEPLIRHLISALKAKRDAVKQTVMELDRESLETLHRLPNSSSQPKNKGIGEGSTPKLSWSPVDTHKLDLETAVLMQELMAMKEERAELRAQMFLMEKEKESLELRLQSHESQEEAYRARINYLKSEIMDWKRLQSSTALKTADLNNQNHNQNDISKAQQQNKQVDTDNNRNLETINNNNNNDQSFESTEREVLLKNRIRELAGTLEKVTATSQIREKHNQAMINELNRANAVLMQTLDSTKKKYLNRVKKMEDQIVFISERHAAQMQLFNSNNRNFVK